MYQYSETIPHDDQVLILLDFSVCVPVSCCFAISAILAMFFLFAHHLAPMYSEGLQATFWRGISDYTLLSL